jgi:hypothetical protein
MSTETSLTPGFAVRGLHTLSKCFRISAVLLALPLAASGPASAADFQSAVLTIRYRNAQALSDVAAPLLSPAGRMSVDQRTNALIVVDTPDAIARVSDLIKQLDQPPVPLRIEVRFEQARAGAGRKASAEGSVSGDGWQVSTGPDAPDGVQVRVESRTDTQAGETLLSVTTLSGSPARVGLGIEIPYRQTGKSVCRRYGGCPSTVTFQRVQTGFWVTPLVVGDRIDLEIVPEIADLDAGRRIRFAAASTHLAVQPGRWIEIGGGKNDETKALAEILGISGGRRQDSFSIFLKVEKLDIQR